MLTCISKHIHAIRPSAAIMIVLIMILERSAVKYIEQLYSWLFKNALEKKAHSFFRFFYE